MCGETHFNPTYLCRLTSDEETPPENGHTLQRVGWRLISFSCSWSKCSLIGGNQSDLPRLIKILSAPSLNWGKSCG